MTATTPCHRHPRRVWTVACPDCTAWHVEIALARCDEVVASLTTAPTPDRSTCRPEAADVPPAVLHLAA
jgi:hypothetical protein